MRIEDRIHNEELERRFVLEESVYELKVPLEFKRQCAYRKLFTIEDLIKETEIGLLYRWRNVGPKTVDKIKRALAKKGFELSKQPPTNEEET